MGTAQVVATRSLPSPVYSLRGTRRNLTVKEKGGTGLSRVTHVGASKTREDIQQFEERRMSRSST